MIKYDFVTKFLSIIKKLESSEIPVTPQNGRLFSTFFFSFFFSQNGRLFAFFFLFTFVFPKRPAFKQKKIFHKAKKKQTKNISGLEFLLDPELRGRSTGSMVRDFVLGITFSPKILVKLRRPFASASISLKLYSKMLPKKKSLTLATAAVRLRRPLAT